MPERTPYNSMYENLPRKQVGERSKTTCCTHGQPCKLGKTVPAPEDAAEEPQYENVAPLRSSKKERKEKREKKNRQNQMFINLTDKLKDLTVESFKKTKSSRKPVERESLTVNLDSESSEKFARSVQQVTGSEADPEQLYENLEVVNCPSDESENSQSKKKKNKKKKRSYKKKREKFVEGYVELSRSDKKTSRKKDQRTPSRSRSEKSSRSSGSRHVQLPDPKKVESRIIEGVYVGVCNYAEAENKVAKKTEFRIYHQLSNNCGIDDLVQELPLILCYKTTNGSYRHYPICNRKAGERSLFFVEYGNPKPETHFSLGHLIRFYQQNVEVNSATNENGDVFPWDF